MKKMVCGMAALLSLSLTSCNYNTLVSERETVESAWAEVENQYQRRMDLIPNVVNTVKGYAEHEQNTLNMVTSARAKASSIQLSVDDLDEETLAQYQKAQDELSRGLGRLMAVAEAYPDLKANQNFLQLQDQLEGTENRIAVARRNFTEAAKSYNTEISKFPTVIYAGWFGFKRKPYFSAQSGAEYAPTVDFGN